MTVVINDLHCGVKRQGGTTPESAALLRVWQYEQLEALLSQIDDDLIINGDLFDSFQVDPGDVIITYNILADWLSRVSTAHSLTLLCGNHDHNPRGEKTSSFHFLAHFLKGAFPSHVRVIDYSDGLTRVEDGLWGIPHMPNQALFDLQLDEALKINKPGWLLLHANYNNNFAIHADHSLNVSQDQVDALLLAGWSLLFGHEHQHRLMRGGRVIIAGNQIPTSIADLLNCDGKYYTELVDSNMSVIHRFMDLPEVFVEQDWRELEGTDAKFIRVVGDASAEEASAAVDAVAKFRQQSCALVVSNAVKVEGVAGMDQMAELSVEALTQFSVMEALLAELTEKEGEKVLEIMQ